MEESLLNLRIDITIKLIVSEARFDGEFYKSAHIFHGIIVHVRRYLFRLKLVQAKQHIFSLLTSMRDKILNLRMHMRAKDKHLDYSKAKNAKNSHNYNEEDSCDMWLFPTSNVTLTYRNFTITNGGHCCCDEIYSIYISCGFVLELFFFNLHPLTIDGTYEDPSAGKDVDHDHERTSGSNVPHGILNIYLLCHEPLFH